MTVYAVFGLTTSCGGERDSDCKKFYTILSRMESKLLKLLDWELSVVPPKENTTQALCQLLDIQGIIFQWIKALSKWRQSYGRRLPSVLLSKVTKYLSCEERLLFPLVCRSWHHLQQVSQRPAFILAFPEHHTFWITSDLVGYQSMALDLTPNGNLLLVSERYNGLFKTSPLLGSLDHKSMINVQQYALECKNHRQEESLIYCGHHSTEVHDHSKVTFQFKTTVVPLRILSFDLFSPTEPSLSCESFPCIGNPQEFSACRELSMRKKGETQLLRNDQITMVTLNNHLVWSGELSLAYAFPFDLVGQQRRRRIVFERLTVDNHLSALKVTKSYVLGVVQHEFLAIWDKNSGQLKKLSRLGRKDHPICGDPNLWTANDFCVFWVESTRSNRDLFHLKACDLFSGRGIPIPSGFTFNRVEYSGKVRGLCATNEFLFVLIRQLHRLCLKYL